MADGPQTISLDEIDSPDEAPATISLDDIQPAQQAQPSQPSPPAPAKPEPSTPMVPIPRGRGDVSHAKPDFFPPTDIPIQGVKDIRSGYEQFSGLPVPVTPMPPARGQVARTAPPPAPPPTPEEQAQANQRAAAAAKIIQGAGEVGSVALPGAAAAAPVATAASLGAGMASSSGLGAAVHGHVSPEAEELTRQLAFFLPSALGTVAGVRSSRFETPESMRAAGFPDITINQTEALGGRVKAGIARTPAGVTARVKVGDTVISVPGGRQPLPEPSEAAKALADFEQHSGNPDFQPAPAPPAPPGANGPEHLTPDIVKGVSEAIRRSPEEKRPDLMIEAHSNMVKWMMGRGTFTGPDSKVYTVDNIGQAKKLASKFINDEVDRVDQEQEKAAKAAAAGPSTINLEETAPAAEPVRTVAPVSGPPPEGKGLTTDSPAVQKVAQEADIHPEQKPSVLVKEESPKDTAKLAQPPDPVTVPDVKKIGKEDPESGRTILQPSGDVMQNERLAADAAPELTTRLSHIAAGIDGATFDRVRPQKELERLDEKTDLAGKPAETIPDYLAAQIAADTPQAKDQLIAELRKQFKVIEVEDSFLEGREKLAGYPSANVQVQMDNGLTAEVQIVPREVQEIANESHKFYTAGREAELRGDHKERDRQFAEAQKLHEEALGKFKQRNGIGGAQYKYEPLEAGELPEGKFFYHGTPHGLTELKEANPVGFSGELNIFGPGLYLTDHPQVAEGYRRTKKAFEGREAERNVISAELPGAKILDLEKALPENALTVFNKHIESYTPIGMEAFPAGTKGADIYRELRDESAAQRIPAYEIQELLGGIAEDLTKLGYHGLRHEGGRMAGLNKKYGPHNVVVLFPDYAAGKGTAYGNHLSVGESTGVAKTVHLDEVEPAKQYDFGSTQINIPPESRLGKAHAKAVAAIPDEHLMPTDFGGNPKGREDQPHVTVRYGLKDDGPKAIEKIREAAGKIQPFEVPIGKTDTFPASVHSDGAVPVIARLETTPELMALRDAVEAAGGFKEDNFPEYKPHVTLAYVKPKFAQQYEGGGQLEGQKVTVDHIVVSKKDGSQEQIKLGGEHKPIRIKFDVSGGRTGEEAEAAIKQKYGITYSLPTKISEKDWNAGKGRLWLFKDGSASEGSGADGHAQMAKYGLDIPVKHDHIPSKLIEEFYKRTGAIRTVLNTDGETLVSAASRPTDAQMTKIAAATRKLSWDLYEGKGHVYGKGDFKEFSKAVDGFYGNAPAAAPHLDEVEPARYVGPERRTHLAERKRVEHMTHEERAHALLTDEKTGLANYRAFKEDEGIYPHVGYADMDDFKSFNTAFGHDAVDQIVLPALGELLRDVVGDTAGLRVYHRSGDEFLFRAQSPALVTRVVDEINQALAKTIFRYKTPEGKLLEKKGTGLSHGTGPDEAAAERASAADKQARKEAGLRTGERDVPAVAEGRPAEEPPARGRTAERQKVPQEVTLAKPEPTTPDVSKNVAPGEPETSTIEQGNEQPTPERSEVREPAGEGGNAPAPVPAGGNQAPRGERDTRIRAAAEDRAVLGSPEAGPPEGNESARGTGSRTAVHPGPRRERRPERSGEVATGADGQPVEAPTPQPVPEAQETAGKLRNSRNFRIEDEQAEDIGSGGDKTKINLNLGAIELLKKIEKEERLPTPEEQKQLARYVDFGGLRKIWDQPWNFRDVQERMEEFLTKQEIAAIKETSLNTHYTSIPVVDAMWKAAKRLGFEGGRILEPGMGIGNFFGRIPKGLASKSHLMGVEKNIISGRMAQMLYPDARIVIRPYEEVPLPDDSMDMIIGNPPFADIKIFDPLYKNPKLAVHNYFIIKSLDKLKPGGIAVLVTSHHTLDAADTRPRQEMFKRADLIGAIRLPNNAFKKNAGTEVTTDILFFRKRMPGELEKAESKIGPMFDEPWLNTVEMTVGPNGEKAAVNEYFKEHPEMALGEHSLAGTMYRAGEYALTPKPGDLAEHLKAAIEKLPQDVFGRQGFALPIGGYQGNPDAGFTDPDNLAPLDVKDNAFYVEDGKVWIKQKGARTELPEHLNKPGTMLHLKAAVTLRDALKETIRAQMADESDAQLKAAQKALSKLYEDYRRKYGPLTGPKTARVFQDDPEYPLLTALENVDPESKEVSKADIFTKRTARPYQPLRDLPADPKAAMLKVLAEKGKLDTKLMAKLLKKPEAEIVDALTKQDLIYRDPVSGTQVTADEYLSGNIRVKLKQAKAAAELDPEFERNAKALEAVQPEPIKIVDIEARLGQTWIPLKFYTNFIHELAGSPYGDLPSIERDHEGRWSVSLPSRYNAYELQHTWAGGDIPGHKLIEYALNQQQPTVYFPPDSNGHRDIDATRTAAARAKLQEIKDKFSEWIKADQMARFHPELEEKYNDTFNGVRLRDYNGAHLEFPGLNPDFKPRPYQASAVWRIIQEGRALIDHFVGAGKTLTMMSAGMELRRMGLSRKNLYVVPNNMVPQWREDFKRAYPGANVLAVTDQDLSSAKNRRRLFSRIATNEWDAVIVPHSQFNMLPISPERETLSINKQKAELEEVLDALKEKAKKGGDQADKRTLRQIENSKQKYEQRLKELSSGRKDNTIYFDDLGIDQLFIDEAHAYKALPFATKMGNISGLSTRRSQRAQNVLAKIEYMFDTHKGRGVAFATGTPITNTVGEQFLMTKYLAPDLLEKAGIRHFDDWAANFATAVTRMEYSTDGVTIKPKTSLSEYVNVPELQQLWSQFADVIGQETAVKAGYLKLPKPIRKDILVKVTPDQEPMLAEIAERGEKLMKRRGPPQKGEDNWLKLDTDSRDISLDARFYDPNAEDHPDSKANQAVGIVKDVLNRTKEQRGTVLVVVDRYESSKSGFNILKDMKQKLVAQGVPASEVAIVHDFPKREQFQAMQAKMRDGRIRVLFGTTEKTGVGLNIQTRLKALVHLDLPQRPDQVTQREGRIIRHGNMFDEVEIYRLISEPRSVNSPKAHDLQRAQLLERKQTFLTQFKEGGRTGRRMEDVAGDVKLNPQMFAIAKAEATGNPMAMEKIKVEHEIKGISLLNRAYTLERHRNLQELERAEMLRASLKDMLPKVQEAQRLWKENEVRDKEGKLVSFKLKLNNREFTNLKDANEYMKANPEIGDDTQLAINGVQIPIANDNYKFLGEWHSFPKSETAEKASAQSVVTSILARARNIEAKASEVENRAAANADHIEKLKKELQKKSPYEDKLKQYEQRLAEIEAELLKGVKPEEDLVDANASEPEEEPNEEAIEEQAGAAGAEEDEPPDTTGFEPGSLGAHNPISLSYVAGREAVKAAKAFYEQDVAPVVKDAGMGLREIGVKALNVMAPRLRVSPHALDVAMRMKGEREKQLFYYQQATEGLRKMFNKMPEAARVAFVDRVKLGQPQPTKELEDAADFLRTTMERFRNEEKMFNPNLSDKDDYFPVRWRVIPGSRKVKGFADRGRRPLQGSKSFMKQQTLPDMSSGIAAGGVPISTNPVNLVEARVLESLKYTTARKMWEEYQSTPYTIGAGGKIMHLVQFFRDKQAQEATQLGYRRLDDSIAKVLFPAASGEGMVKAGEYWVEANAARLLNNFLSRDYIRESTAGRGIVSLKNQLTAWRLGFSPFHLVTESILSAGSEIGRGLEHAWNRGVRRGSAGEIGRGAAIAGKALGAPFGASREGGKSLRFMADPAMTDILKKYPDATDLINDFFSGGGKFRMHEDIQLHAAEGLQRAMAENNYLGALLRTPFAANQLMQYPMFELWIPRLKFGMFLREMSEQLAERQPEIDAGKLTREQLAREVVNSVDARFGELNWDNFFWNRTFKTAVQLAFRAFSWTFGNFRFAGSAVKGQSQEVFESLKYLHDAATGGDSARPGTTAIPRLHPDMAKLLGMLLLGAALHTALQLYLTHEMPKDAKDLIAPRDGTMDTHGRPNRWMLPLVPFKDLLSLKDSPINYAESKFADIWQGTVEAMHNRDFQGHLISHPSDPYWEQLYDRALHVLGSPIGYQRYSEERKHGESRGTAMMGEMGLSRVGKGATMSPAEKKMREIQRLNYGGETDEDLEAREKRQARIAVGGATPAERKRQIKESLKSEFERGMEHFSYEDAKQVYDVASPEEKRMMGLMLLRRRFNSRRTGASVQ